MSNSTLENECKYFYVKVLVIDFKIEKIHVEKRTISYEGCINGIYKVIYDGEDGYTHVDYYDAEDDYDRQRAITVELESDTLEDIYTDGVDYCFEDDSAEKIVVMHVLEIEED